MSAALATVATLTVSCRSVASKTVACLTGTGEFDTFLEASMPGCVVPCCIQRSSQDILGIITSIEGPQFDSRVWQPRRDNPVQPQC